jgi:hypothetical protein
MIENQLFIKKNKKTWKIEKNLLPLGSNKNSKI